MLVVFKAIHQLASMPVNSINLIAALAGEYALVVGVVPVLIIVCSGYLIGGVVSKTVVAVAVRFEYAVGILDKIMGN